MADRLANEKSPYLRQHADNPVDWYPWGHEAFEVAKREDKPVFVSIGYAACHWCHVMAHESFEDAETAALMNDLFVNIKVDREEHPDVDTLYMNAIQVMGDGGGWPLSAFCIPDGTPYFLGTYFPPEDKYGRPSFSRVLSEMARVYREQHDEVLENTVAIKDGLARLDAFFRESEHAAGAQGLSDDILVAAGRALLAQCDKTHGGLGKAPKFPSPSVHDLLARCSRFSFGEGPRNAFTLQAQAMADGGIYDHLGGGFARYSVDERWLVPHFEKMLYDNAQLLSIYADACAITQNPRFEQVIAETVAWLAREMSDEAGGLHASIDADSEGQEGKFYVFDRDDLREALGPVASLQFAAAYGVTGVGNFEHGKSVLSRVRVPASTHEQRELAALCGKLFTYREKRIRPATDDKVLAGWNGLAITGLCHAFEATEDETAKALALRVANFLRDRMIEGDRLQRVFHGGQSAHGGTLNDYAFVARGFFDLAEVTEDGDWWNLGESLTRSLIEKFYDGERNAFYLSSAEDAEMLMHRPESNQDGAIPAGASVALECLLRVADIRDDPTLATMVEKYLASRLPGADGAAVSSARLLAVLDQYLHSAVVVISEGEGREALRSAAMRAYAPTLVIAGEWATSPVLAGKAPGPRGQALAYICRGQSCMAPIDNPKELGRALES